MTDVLELRRTIVRRETEIYVAGLFCLLVSVAMGFMAVRAWLGVTSATGVAPTFVALVVTLLLGLALWLSAPCWQLILLPGHPEDVVLLANGGGLVLRDAGYTIAVPWSSVATLRIEPGRGMGGTPALVPVVTGPVTRSRDPLALLVVRGLRRGTLSLGVGPGDPTPEQVGVAVLELPDGQQRVT